MRVLARISIFLTTLALLLGPALYLGRDSLAPAAISWVARIGLGVDDPGGLDFRITELSTNALTVKSLTAGDGAISADTVQATFDPAELLGGQLRSLTVTGLTLRAAFRNGRLDLGPLGDLLHTETEERPSSGGPERLPVDTLVLKAAGFILGTPWGAIDLRGDISAGQGPDGTLNWTGALGGIVTSDDLGGGGAADIDIRLEGGRDVDGTATSSLSLVRGMARFRDLAMERASGTVEFRFLDRNPMVTRAALRFEGLRANQTEIPMVSLEAIVRGDSGSLTATIGSSSARDRNYTVAAAVENGDGARVRLTFTGDGPVTSLYRMAGGTRKPLVGNPRGELDFRGNVTLPGPIASLLAAPETALTGMVGTGGVDVSISSLRSGGRVHRGELKARMAAIVAPGLVELRAVDTWRMRIPKSLSRSLAVLAPEAVRYWFEEGVAVELGRDRAAPSVLVDFTGPRARARISGTLTGALGSKRRVELGGSATVYLPKAGLADNWSAELDDVTVRLSDVEIEGLRLRNGEATFSGHVDPNRTAGAFKLGGDLMLAGAEISAEAGVKLAGRIASLNRETRLSLGQLEIRADALAHRSSGLSLSHPATVSQASGTITEIALSSALGGYFAREVKAALDIGPIVLGLPSDGQPRPLKIALGRITGHLMDGDGPEGGTLQLTMSGGRVDDGRIPIAVSGATASAGFLRGDKGPRIRAFGFELPEIVNPNQPAWFAPFRIKMTGVSDVGGETLSLQGSIASGSGAVVLPLSGVLRPGDGSGRITLARTMLSLDPASLALGDLSPALGDHINSIRGGISLAGHLRWPDIHAKDAQRFSVELKDMTLQGEEFEIEKARGDFTFLSLAPLRTDGIQSVALDMLGIGVAIERPRMEVSVDGLDRVKLHHVSGGFAGGTISASNIDLSMDKPTRTTILVHGVSASDLTGLAKVDGLHAEGTLSGTLPVTWSPGVGLSVTDAKLTADGPGKVRYLAGGREAALRQSGEQVGLMLDALSDFRFEVLDLKLNGAPGEDYRIALVLEGANPKLYDGYPVRFNLDLSGQLDDIIKTGYRTYSLPTRVRDAVLRGGANE